MMGSVNDLVVCLNQNYVFLKLILEIPGPHIIDSIHGIMKPGQRKQTRPRETYYSLKYRQTTFPCFTIPNYRDVTVAMYNCISVSVATQSSKYSYSYPHGQTQTAENKGKSHFPQFCLVPTLKVCTPHKQACCFVTINHMAPLWRPSLPSWPLSLIAN